MLLACAQSCLMEWHLLAKARALLTGVGLMGLSLDGCETAVGLGMA